MAETETTKKALNNMSSGEKVSETKTVTTTLPSEKTKPEPLSKEQLEAMTTLKGQRKKRNRSENIFKGLQAAFTSLGAIGDAIAQKDAAPRAAQNLAIYRQGAQTREEGFQRQMREDPDSVWSIVARESLKDILPPNMFEDGKVSYADLEPYMGSAKDAIDMRTKAMIQSRFAPGLDPYKKSLIRKNDAQIENWQKKAVLDRDKLDEAIADREEDTKTKYMTLGLRGDELAAEIEKDKKLILLKSRRQALDEKIADVDIKKKEQQIVQEAEMHPEKVKGVVLANEAKELANSQEAIYQDKNSEESKAMTGLMMSMQKEGYFKGLKIPKDGLSFNAGKILIDTAPDSIRNKLAQQAAEIQKTESARRQERHQVTMKQNFIKDYDKRSGRARIILEMEKLISQETGKEFNFGDVSDTSDPDVDIPGLRLKNFLATSPKAKEFKAKLAKLFNMTLKDRSGVAVTPTELIRLKDEYGEGWVQGSEAVFMRLMRDVKDEMTAKMGSSELIAQEHIPQFLKDYYAEGNVSSDELKAGGIAYDWNKTRSPMRDRITYGMNKKTGKYGWFNPSTDEFTEDD
jgi:hypothetical protein